VDWFLRLLDAWGYLIVAGFTVFENLFVLGSFTPGETVVIAAAFVASGGGLTVWGVAGASLVGTLIGSNASYILGRRAGLSAVSAFAERVAATRIGRLLRIDPNGMDEVHEHFHTDGAKTVFISRFAVGAKNFVPAVAGAVRMPFFWFELYTLLGAITYTAAMCAIGWFLGQNFKYALRIATSMGWVGLALLAVFVTFVVAGRRRIKARREARAEEEGSDEDPALESAPDFDDAE